MNAIKIKMREVKTEEEMTQCHAILKKEIYETFLTKLEYNSTYFEDNNPKNHCFLFQWKNEIVGIAKLEEIDKETFQLRSLAFKKEYQRKGFGSQALHLLEKQAQNFEKKKMVANANPEALEFYKKINTKRIFGKAMLMLMLFQLEKIYKRFIIKHSSFLIIH